MGRVAAVGIAAISCSDGSDGCGANTCIARGTLVATPDGPVPVESLRIGDLVVTIDPETKELHPAPIKAIRHGRRECARLATGTGQELICTSDHPIYAPETGTYQQAARFVEASLGQVLVFHDGAFTVSQVTGRTTYVGVLDVYDLTVESPFHSFIAHEIVVHNKDYGYGVPTTSTEDDTTTQTQTDTGTPESYCDGPVSIPEGSFWMGCHQPLEPPCDDDSQPHHQVMLDAFDIDRCEVTVARYDACIEQGGCSDRPASEECNSASLGRVDHPANCVSWEQAAAYCDWAGGTLPTEAQWERAARGLDTRVFPWGDNTGQACSRAVMGGDCEWESTEPVGIRPDGASPDHVMDMAGNVAEWVSDWYDPQYYETSPELEPQGPATGDQRVVRGGHFGSTLAEIRVLTRAADDPAEALPAYGFRCTYQPPGDGGSTDTGTGSSTGTGTGSTTAGTTGSDSTEASTGSTGTAT